MRNPNETLSTVTQTANNLVLEWKYNSENLAKYDFKSIQETYANAQSATINGKVITVVIAIVQ
jgi:hypothetical protein